MISTTDSPAAEPRERYWVGDGPTRIVPGRPWAVHDSNNHACQVAPINPHPDDIPSTATTPGEWTSPQYVNPALAYFATQDQAQQWVDEHNAT